MRWPLEQDGVASQAAFTASEPGCRNVSHSAQTSRVRLTADVLTRDQRSSSKVLDEAEISSKQTI